MKDVLQDIIDRLTNMTERLEPMALGKITLLLLELAQEVQRREESLYCHLDGLKRDITDTRA